MFSINTENFGNYCFTNSDKVSDFYGIVVEFHGLNGGLDMISTPNNLSEYCTKNNLLYVFPYLSPWNWMNDAAVDMTDDILDVIFEKYGLKEDFPVTVAGRSMGGQCALIYCVNGKWKPVACALNCPVCDMQYHYNERLDVPRTIYSACCGKNVESLEKAIQHIDPMSRTADMPHIPYCLAHCEKDTKVNIAKHSLLFIEEMRRLGHDITFISVPDRDHIDITDDAREKLYDSLNNAIRRRG